jgi:TetR/AcrR family transcriptional regulator, tetracycline repressor protein
VRAQTTKKDELSRDAIVDRAIAIADVEGLEAVSIRRLGQQFGVTPMALYWHVQNKDELLAAMGDRIFADIDLPRDRTQPWDERLRRLMVVLLAGLRRHPALLPLAFQRVTACPDGLELTETALQILRDGGFSARDAAGIAVHALRSTIGLIAGEPGTEEGRPDPEHLANMALKRARLELLPAQLYPRLLESADDLLACKDRVEYDELGIDLFISGVLALASR